MKAINADLWPPGTRLEGQVISNECSILAILCPDGRGHLIINRKPMEDEFQMGEQVVIVWRNGGPTGGYWDVFRKMDKRLEKG